MIEDVPKMIRMFEKEHNVQWKDGRVYFDEKKKEKTAGKKEKKRKQIQKEKNQHLLSLLHSHQNHHNPRQVKS